MAYELGIDLDPVPIDLTSEYVRAFEEANLDALVALFHADMRTTMPPAPPGSRDARPKSASTAGCSAARCPGNSGTLAFYRPAAPGAPHTLAAIQLVETRGGAISAVDHFMLSEIYPLFGVPRERPQP